MLESLFNKVAGEVFKNTFFYRTPPVTASVVFATKQLNIQCYNDNLKLSWKYGNYHHLPYKVMIISISYQEYAHLVQKFCSLSHQSPNFMILSSISFCIISIFLRESGVSHSYKVHLIESLSKIDRPIYKESNSPLPQKCF